MEAIFHGLFDGAAIVNVSVTDFLLCLFAALMCGAFLAFCHGYRSRHTKSFVITLALLPAVVCVVIMMVNGNVGAGVAVAGAFSLVRFRSVPGTAREITMLFLAMGAGLICGMGYLAFALLFTIILGLLALILCQTDLLGKGAGLYKTITITIPEDLSFTGVFDDVLQSYCTRYELMRVKTTNMGSLFRLTYHVTMMPAADEKALMDELRVRNGNLEISISRQDTAAAEL